MIPEPIWRNSVTVLNLASGPRCGTITRMGKKPGMTKWTTAEGTTRPGLWWPAMKELVKVNNSHKSVESGGGHNMDVTASEKVDRDGDRRSDVR